MRIVIGITGATGSIYGIKLLQELNKRDVETHLIISEWAKNIIEEETDYSLKQVEDYAHFVHDNNDFNASVASGSFQTDGMVIAPCSMKTLASVTNGLTSNLIVRSADVAMKEKRKLIIVPRETPLNTIHLENMLKLSRIGARIVPPMPAFYYKPQTLEDIINHIVSRILDQLDLDNHLFNRWGE